MKRLKIMKAYAVLWLFIYFLVNSNLEAMETFFFATLTFNLAVLTVLVIGIIVIMKSSINLVMLAGTFGTLAYKKDNISFYLQGIEKIMPANIAHMFHSRAEKGVLLFTTDESRAVVEWIDEKFSNQNRYVNYFIGTALMIGLLGTFSGLLVSIDQMGKIILSLTGDIDLGEVIRSFAGPLGGMAVGFGSSLFGVISAIILGLMGYILNKNQEVLIEGVEDWLKGRIIDSGGAATTSVSVPGQEAGAELPEHRSSFMDVFIDNIASLTKEMAKISQTNERLHSITVASVQQARDEHEVSVELFEQINTNLHSINNSTQESTQTLQEKLTNIEHVVNSSQEKSAQHLTELLTTLSEKLLRAQEDASTQNIQKVQELKGELSTISTLLQTAKEQDIQSSNKLLENITQLTQKLENEIKILEDLEKLSKISINDTRKQSAVLIQTHTQSQEESKELLEKQRALLDILVGKNDENINELRRIPSSNSQAPVNFSSNTQKADSFFSKLFK